MIIPLQDYPGKKAAEGAYQKILAEVPRCKRFVDAMCGSGFIGSLVTGCQVILNDINRTVIDKIICTGDQVGNNQAYGVIKENLHYQVLVNKYDGLAGTVLYFDPPYLLETRSHKNPIYKYEWIKEDHTLFLKAVRALKSPVIISHYPCGLYNTKLKGWRRITYRTMTRGGVREEAIYMNFPQPILLQLPGYVGHDYIDRQRIKRKISKLISRLDKEPAQYRAAILSSIIDKFDYAIS